MQQAKYNCLQVNLLKIFSLFFSFKLSEWNKKMDELIILVARLWGIEVSDLGGLINEFDTKEDRQDQVSGCFVWSIYVLRIIRRERYRANSSKLKFIIVAQQTQVFPGQLSQDSTDHQKMWKPR